MAGTAFQRFLSGIRRALLRFEDQRSANSSTFFLRIAVEADELDGGFIATVVDMPGCVSEGATQQEAVENAMDAFAEMISAQLDAQIEGDPAARSTKRNVHAGEPKVREYKVAVGC